MSPHRGATLAVLCAMALMIVLDSTIVAVAVPSIQRDLGFSAAGVAWVVNAYLVAFAGLLLLAGRLGDLIGARPVFLAGVAVFTLASLLCGLAPDAAWLLAGRFLQGAGGALASAVIFGMIVRLYPSPGGQARALGIYSFTQAGGAAIGFVAGGLLTDGFGWPAIFLVNVPIGIATLVLGLRLLPAATSAPARPRGLDVSGATLITAGLSLGVCAIVGPTRFATLAAGGSVLLIGGFLVRQRYARTPLIPLRLIGRPWLLRANAVMMLLFAAGMGFQFLTALFMQRVMGFDALRTGLAFLPAPLVIGVVSLFVAARLTARFGPLRVLAAGLASMAAGLLLLARIPAAPSYWPDMLPPLAVMGLGVGVAVPAVIMLAMAGAAPSESGLVSGFGNTAQQAGGALGLAVLASVAASRGGYGRGFLVAAALVVAALVLAALLLRHQPAPPAEFPPLSAAAGPAGPDSGRGSGLLAGGSAGPGSGRESGLLAGGSAGPGSGRESDLLAGGSAGPGSGRESDLLAARPAGSGARSEPDSPNAPAVRSESSPALLAERTLACICEQP